MIMELSFEEFYSFTSTLTREAQEIILADMSSGVSHESKTDGTIVTQTDLAVERLIRSKIEDRYGDHGIVGEEYGDRTSGSRYTWVVDPIDGTMSYFLGVPFFGTLIGLLYEGKPLYGAMRLPMFDQILAGDGAQCLINDERAAVKGFQSWEDAIVLTTDEERIRQSEYAESWEKFGHKGCTFRTWGDCYGYSLVCSGKADVMIDIQLKPCDILPILPIVEGAGASKVDFGKNENQDLALCLPSVEREISELFQIVV